MAALPDVIGQTVGGLIAGAHGGGGRRQAAVAGSAEAPGDSSYRLDLDHAPVDLSAFYNGLAVDQAMVAGASQSMQTSTLVAGSMLEDWYAAHPQTRPTTSESEYGRVTNAVGNMGSATVGGGDAIAFYLAIVRSGEPFYKVFDGNKNIFAPTAEAGHYMANQAITSARENAGQWQLSYILSRMSGQTGDNLNLQTQVEDIGAYIADNNNWRNSVVEQGFVDLAKTEYGLFTMTGAGTLVDLGARAVTGDLHASDILNVTALGKWGIGKALGKLESAVEEVVPEGIVYLRTDITGKIAPYGGQAMSDARYIARQAEHARDFPDAKFRFQIIDRANPGSSLDIAEHNFIQELTGGVAARRSSAVSNLRDPVGAARRPGFGLPEPR